MSLQMKFNKRKVTIVGVGNVGASIAYALTIRNLAREIALIDIDEERAKGEALDIQHGIPYMGIANVYCGTYEDCVDSDLVIITAGRNRRVGETRLNLIEDNKRIMGDIVDKMLPHLNRSATILVVSNPVDILTYKCAQWLGMEHGQVFGTGNILDTSRMTRYIADYVHLNTEVVKCNVVGEHGDGQVPIWSRLSIAGVPMDEYCENTHIRWDDAVREQVRKKVRQQGAEIIRAKGKTHYGIATCVCFLADAVLNQRLTISTVSSPFHGEYGIEGVSLSVPSIVGVNGVERRLEERWSEEEYAKFCETAEKLKEFIN